MNLEQLAAQYASQAEDARTEQHDAAGLRSRAGGGAVVVVVPPLPDREGFRRDRAEGVLRGADEAPGVLIPVNRIAAGNAGVLQVEPVGAGFNVGPFRS